jgi:DNA-binding beta-propeller fold protein YncE
MARAQTDLGSVTVGNRPSAVAVNPATGTLLVGLPGDNQVMAVDEATSTLTLTVTK